jgi:hypothetical protein
MICYCLLIKWAHAKTGPGKLEIQKKTFNTMQEIRSSAEMPRFKNLTATHTHADLPRGAGLKGLPNPDA